MKKFVSVMLTVAMLVGLMLPVFASAEPVTLTFKALTWLAAEQEMQKSLIDQWNAEHPDIQVQLMGADWTNASQELLTAFETGDVPDIFHYAQPVIADWKDLGFLEDLTPMLSEEDLADVNADVWDGLKSSDGKIVGLPIQMEVDVIYYNKDVFERNGITPPTMEEPWTLDHCVEVARQLEAAEGEGFQGLSYYNLGNYGRFFTEVIATKLGDPLVYKNEDGSLYMKLSDESVAHFKMVKDLLDEGIISQEDLVDCYTILPRFLNGQTGMVLGYGNWYRTQFINESEGTAGINWGTAAPYKLNDTSVYGYIQTLSVPSASKHKAEAMEFLKWYWSAENVLKVAKAAFIMPGRNSAINDPELSTSEYDWDICQEAVKHNLIPDYVKLAGWGQVTEGFGSQLINEYFVGGMSLEDMVSTWERRATATLNEALED